MLIGRPLTRTWSGAPDRDASRVLAACTAVAGHARRLARAAEGVHGDPAVTAACARLARLTAAAVAGRPVPAGSCAAVVDLLVGPAAGRGPSAAPAREAGLLAAELAELVESAGPDARTTGRVRGPAGAPVAATVTVVDAAGRQLDRVATGDDGRFAVGVPAGTHLLVVTPVGAGAAPGGARVAFGAGAVLPDVVLDPTAPAPVPAPVRAPVPAGPGVAAGVGRGPARVVGRGCVGHV
ncbi:carboxypeptidase-like regulatory domain-containing protein [Pseudonocardia spirodelae]|uniref:Carboxypeptidase-like regulatory domain-containing protein n=1 Tax=Pseudonocardia spirodelae TaxID=3133431 RepID=A0ABU8TA86_9PSEU